MDQAAPGTNRLWVIVALLVGLGAGLGGALLLNMESEPELVVPVDTSDATRDGDPDAAAELPPVDPGIAPQDATDAETALRGFLSAEATGDWELSYEFLAESNRTVAYPSAALWINAHADFPTVTGYRIDDVVQVDDRANAEALIGFESMIDPVLGLVPARGRETFNLLEEDGLWRVEATTTEYRPLYPGSDGAQEAARQWVDARVACADTSDLEADLVGSPALAVALCEEDQPDPVEIGALRTLSDSDGITALLSEFGPEVFAWSRSVPVDATTPILLVLGPVGEEWQVVGVLPRL